MIDSFPLVSVYIPSYNYGKFLSQAIESVLKQTFDSWELILIDEGSSDNSLEVMNLYKGDPKVRLYETDHIGLPGVANFAINNSNGKYIIRLDADDVFDDNALLVMSNYLEKNADTALVFPDFWGKITQELHKEFILNCHYLLVSGLFLTHRISDPINKKPILPFSLCL